MKLRNVVIGLFVGGVVAGIAWFVRGVKECRWRSEQGLHIRCDVVQFADQYERISKLGDEDLRHDYLLYTIGEVYEEFENRVASAGQKRGEKTRSVTAVLNDMEGKFTVRDIEWKCPGVSKETIKSVLKSHPECFVCEGRGVAARWLKIKNL